MNDTRKFNFGSAFQLLNSKLGIMIERSLQRASVVTNVMNFPNVSRLFAKRALRLLLIQ